MAKKKKSNTKKGLVNEAPENMLPQNILPIGERVEENKNIYISQAVYKEIHKFTQNKTTNESGGMLVGTLIEEFGKTNIVISKFVEAKYCEATPTTLKFTHETWDFVHKEIDKNYKGKKILGWIHTHPDFGIFLSEYDKFIHQNFFNEDYQVAYVVDPIQNNEGFYFWINGNIEKCKGFYIYDKTGEKITVGEEREKESTAKSESSLLSIQNIIIAILSVAVIFLIFSNISFNNQLKVIEKQQQALADSANQSLGYMQQQILKQSSEIQELTELLEKVGIIVESEEPVIPDNSENENADSNNKQTDETTDESTTGINSGTMSDTNSNNATGGDTSGITEKGEPVSE